MQPARWFPVATVVTATMFTLAGCTADPRQAPLINPAVLSLPADAGFDYQLGGAYPLPAGTHIVVRDRTAEPPTDAYAVCYLNAFQTQPGEETSWPRSALLRDDNGAVIVDPNWPDEVLLDTSTSATREMVIEAVSEWIRGCAEDGFDAVELDNLDTFTRSGGRFTRGDAITVASALAAEAHQAGLAIGQKNAAEFAAELAQSAGFDFAIAEECAVFTECAAYTAVYGDAVLAIEYVDALPRPFAEVCADQAAPRRTILRDRDLVTPDDPAYVFKAC